MGTAARRRALDKKLKGISLACKQKRRNENPKSCVGGLDGPKKKLSSLRKK